MRQLHVNPLAKSPGSSGSHPDRFLEQLFGERLAVLVVDEHEPGRYDTVYVDLGHDLDFSDERPVTRDSPTACGSFGEDVIEAPLVPGLHAVAVHNVLFSGSDFEVPFTVTLTPRWTPRRPLGRVP